MTQVATDLDGVIALNELPRKLYRPHRMHEFYSKCIYTGFAKGVPIIIITSRKETYRKTTEEWLKENGVVYQCLIMMPIGMKKNRENCILHKEKFIKELKIDTFFEDDPNILVELRKRCPNVKVVDVA